MWCQELSKVDELNVVEFFRLVQNSSAPVAIHCYSSFKQCCSSIIYTNVCTDPNYETNEYDLT